MCSIRGYNQLDDLIWSSQSTPQTERDWTSYDKIKYLCDSKQPSRCALWSSSECGASESVRSLNRNNPLWTCHASESSSIKDLEAVQCAPHFEHFPKHEVTVSKPEHLCEHSPHWHIHYIIVYFDTLSCPTRPAVWIYSKCGASTQNHAQQGNMSHVSEHGSVCLSCVTSLTDKKTLMSQD